MTTIKLTKREVLFLNIQCARSLHSRLETHKSIFGSLGCNLSLEKNERDFLLQLLSKELNILTSGLANNNNNEEIELVYDG